MIYEPKNNVDMVLELHISKENPVFMALPAFTKTSKLRVVFVDAVKFKSVWGGDHSAGNPESWRTDKKFAGVAECFKNSRNFPIPPADIGDLIDGKFKFCDGVTRTIWLLAHDVVYFPLICSTHSFEALEALAGADISDSDLQRRLFPATGAGNPHPKF